MSKVTIKSLDRDDGIEITAVLEVKFVYSVEETSIIDIRDEIEKIIEKHSV